MEGRSVHTGVDKRLESSLKIKYIISKQQSLHVLMERHHLMEQPTQTVRLSERPLRGKESTQRDIDNACIFLISYSQIIKAPGLTVSGLSATLGLAVKLV